MERKKIKIPVILLLVCAIAGGIYYFVFTKKNQDSSILHLYGNIDIRQVQLAFHATGRIQTLHAREGDHAQAGQLLAELDPVRYEAARAKAEAELNARQENLAQLEAGTRPEAISEARARVQAAEARLKNARLLYERTKALKMADSVARQQLDDREMAYQTAQADLNVLQQSLVLAVKGPRDEEIAAARAQVKAAEAALRLAEKELADTKVYAPADGIIQNRILEPGDMAFPQTPVYTLAQTDPVWVRAYLPEPDLGKVIPGMKADIRTDSYPDKTYHGWIGYISPTSEFTPKPVETEDLRTRLVYQIRVYACNPGGELRLGMPVSVAIDLNQPAPAKGQLDLDPCRGN